MGPPAGASINAVGFAFPLEDDLETFIVGMLFMHEYGFGCHREEISL
jgi:hypothetical protein